MTGPEVLLEIDFQYAGRLAAFLTGAVILWFVLAFLATLLLRRYPAARRVRNSLRLFFIPAAIGFFVVRQLSEEKVALDVATTAFAAASVILGLAALDMVMTPQNMKRWWPRD